MMKKLHKVLLAIALAWVVGAAEAQNVSPVDFMRFNPYQINANPATDLPYESVMSILIGNFNLGMQNTSLRYDNLFEFDEQGRPALINLRQFANSVKKDNYLGFNASVDLFTLFRRTKHGLLTINWGVKTEGDARLNDGLFKLLGYGNGAFVGEGNPAVVDMSLNVTGYQELAVGYQMNVTEKLSLGWRGKLLFGAANVTTDAFNAQLTTDADSYALRIREHIAMKASLPSVFYIDESGYPATQGYFRVLDLFKNPGFGVDLAAEYRFNEQFSAVAAVTDLGFIHWRLNNFDLTSNINDAGQFYDHGDFLYNGIGVDQLQLITNDEDYREKFLDSLKLYFPLEFGQMGKYNTMLNTNLLLRANYDVTPCNRFSIQAQGRFMGSGFRPALTLAYCGSFWNNVNVCATYTMMPHSYDNIGLGFSWMMATCNVYLTTNNLIGFFKPLNSSGINAQVGIVFNLWMPERRFIDESGKPEYLE